MQEIVEYTRHIIQSSDEIAINQERLGDCPRCGQPVIAGKRAFGCSAWREGCPFVLHAYLQRPRSRPEANTRAVAARGYP